MNRLKRHHCFAHCTAAALLLLAAGSHGATVERGPTPVAVNDVFGMLFGLVVVIATVIAVGWLYARSRGLPGRAGDIISVVAAQSLGPKERIVLVEIGGKQIVVGMTAAQLQTLHVFDEPVIDGGERVNHTGAFATRLRSMLQGDKR